jgi:L-lactate dehydrogenase complex protein LldF
VLNCIRCGACLNVCPVYRHIGGHAYGSVYSGPIGAVLTPLLQPTRRAGELANASTLCGACFDACPVKIPLHDMLVELRRRNVERGDGAASERVAFRLWARVFSSPRLYRWVGAMMRFGQRVLLGDGTRRRWWSRFLGPLRGWTDHRALPPPSRQSFRAMWKKEEGARKP